MQRNRTERRFSSRRISYNNQVFAAALITGNSDGTARAHGVSMERQWVARVSSAADLLELFKRVHWAHVMAPAPAVRRTSVTTAMGTVE